MYLQNIYGVMDCYVMGLPFFKGTLMGDLFYSSVLFTSYVFIQNKVPRLKSEVA